MLRLRKAVCTRSMFLAAASVSLSSLFSIAIAQEVVVAFGENRPPSVGGAGQGGLEIDIVRASLKEGGHSLKAVQMPVARLKALENMERGEFDAVAGVRGLSSTTHRSNSYISYRNYAFNTSNRALNRRDPAC